MELTDLILKTRRGNGFVDLTGKVFGRLSVLSFAGITTNKRAFWNCQCSCGKSVLVARSELVYEKTRSCGCLKKEVSGRLNLSHGNTRNGKWTTEYISWSQMIQRCTNENCKSYKNYGGRGITICERWRNSFPNFLEDMGKKPTPDLSLDRIKNSGNYEPGNCRWGTDEQQCNNRRSNRVITAFGKTQTLQQWSREMNLSDSTIRARLKMGWTIEKSLSSAICYRG